MRTSGNLGLALAVSAAVITLSTAASAHAAPTASTAAASPTIVLGAASAAAGSSAALDLQGERAAAARRQDGCHMTGAKSYVCVNVKRSGKYIKEAWVNRGNAGQICDYRGTVTVYDGRGRILYQKRSRNHPGCSYLRASVGGTVKRSFPSGRKVCGSWWQGGSVNGRWERVGTACVKM